METNKLALLAFTSLAILMLSGCAGTPKEGAAVLTNSNQSLFKITVTNVITHEPIYNASIYVKSASDASAALVIMRTSKTGYAVANLPVGRYAVSVRKAGYGDYNFGARIDTGKTASAKVSLTPNNFRITVKDSATSRPIYNAKVYLISSLDRSISKTLYTDGNGFVSAVLTGSRYYFTVSKQGYADYKLDSNNGLMIYYDKIVNLGVVLKKTG